MINQIRSVLCQYHCGKCGQSPKRPNWVENGGGGNSKRGGGVVKLGFAYVQVRLWRLRRSSLLARPYLHHENQTWKDLAARVGIFRWKYIRVFPVMGFRYITPIRYYWVVLEDPFSGLEHRQHPRSLLSTKSCHLQTVWRNHATADVDSRWTLRTHEMANSPSWPLCHLDFPGGTNCAYRTVNPVCCLFYCSKIFFSPYPRIGYPGIGVYSPIGGIQLLYVGRYVTSKAFELCWVFY